MIFQFLCNVSAGSMSPLRKSKCVKSVKQKLRSFHSFSNLDLKLRKGWELDASWWRFVLRPWRPRRPPLTRPPWRPSAAAQLVSCPAPPHPAKWFHFTGSPSWKLLQTVWNYISLFNQVIQRLIHLRWRPLNNTCKCKETPVYIMFCLYELKGSSNGLQTC